MTLSRKELHDLDKNAEILIFEFMSFLNTFIGEGTKYELQHTRNGFNVIIYEDNTWKTYLGFEN